HRAGRVVTWRRRHVTTRPARCHPYLRRHPRRLHHRPARLLGQRVRARPCRREGRRSVKRARPSALWPLLAVVLAGCQNSKAAGQEEGESTTSARVEGSRLILPERSPQLASLASAPAAPATLRPARFNGRLV